MTDSNLENLINKYFEGTIDDEQFKLLGNWLATKSDVKESAISKALLDAFRIEQAFSDSENSISSLSQETSNHSAHATV